MSILPPFRGQLVCVGGALTTGQGRRVPAGLYLPRQWVPTLPGLGGSRTGAGVAAALGESPLRGRVRQGLEAQFRGGGMVGGGGGKVQELA